MNTIQKQAVFFTSLCLCFLCAFGVFASTDVFTRDLSLGSQGSDVLVLQQVLREENFFSNPKNTGYFGSQTREALVAYQITHNLSVSGFVDESTRTFLNKSYDTHSVSTLSQETENMKTVDLLIALGIIPQQERAHVRAMITKKSTVSSTVIDLSSMNIPTNSGFGAVLLPVFTIGSTSIPQGGGK